MIRWLALLVGCFALGHGSLASADDAAHPNIVFILADDLGWTDLSCRGSGYYQTPNIDRLAAEGLDLTSYYVCQNCAPTRAAIMSGQYAPRTGIYTVGSLARGDAADRRLVPPENATQLPLEIVTLPQALQSAGYATGMFGKWHLGNGARHHPSVRGFDEAIVSNGRHFNFETNPAVDVPEGAYLADWLTDRAVEFITSHQEEPFFLYLPHFAVHTPLQAKPELIALYESRTPSGGHNHPTYAAMIHSVDESVGRILDTLDALQLAENTVVIFSSDNGGVGSYVVPDTGELKGTTDNSPLREGKGSLYEGGIRVPFFVRWPGVITPGTTCDVPTAHVDLFPTCIGIAGGEMPADQIVDGVNLTPLWRDPDSALDRDAIFWHFPGYLEAYISETTWRTTPVAVIRSGDFKLLEYFEDGHLELYNVTDDISETRNLVESDPEEAERLLHRLHLWRLETEADMPMVRE